MKKRCVVDLKIDESIIGKIKSLCEIYVWDFDPESKKFINPHKEIIKVPYIIPSQFALTGEHLSASIFQQFEEYKSAFIEEIKDRLNQNEEKIGRIKTETKTRSKLKELNDLFLDVLDKPYEYLSLKETVSGKFSVFQINGPRIMGSKKKFFLGSKNKTFHSSRYNSSYRHARIDLDFPFGDSSIDDILFASGVAIDFETAGWEPIRVMEELSILTNDEIKNKFIELSNAYSSEINMNLLNKMKRKDHISGIEKVLNEHKDERLTTACFIDLNGDNYLITTFDSGKDFIDVDVPGQDRKMPVKIIKVSDQQELIKKLNSLYQQYQPFFSYGHNQLKFDYCKANELTGDFNPGIDYEKPRHRSQTAEGFIVLKTIPGRIDIDGSTWAQNFCSLRNNKLDTVFHHLKGILSEKTMSHSELSIKTARAEAGSKEDSKEILYYAAQDGMKSWMIGERIKLEHLLLSKVFNSLPARLDATSKKTLVEDYWVNWWFKNKGTYPIQDLSVLVSNKELLLGLSKYNDFSVIEYIDKWFRKNDIRIKTPRLEECCMISIFPAANAFKDVLERDLNIKRVFGRINKTEDSFEKTRLLRVIDSLAEYPLYRSLSDDNENRFSAEFKLGYNGNNIAEFREKFFLGLDKIKNVINDSLVNIYQNYIFLPKSMSDEIKDICDDNLAVYLSDGNFLSGTKGRIAGNINGQLFLFGISDYLSNKGERCQFEKTFHEHFLNKLLIENNLKSALEYLQKISMEFSNDEVVDNDLLFKRIAKRNFTDYSSGATQNFVSKMVDSQTRKGEELKYSYDKNELYEKFFGIIIESKKSSQMSLFEVNSDNNFSPVKGSISSIVNWKFNFFKNSRGYKLMRELYLGKLDEGYLDEIIHLERFD